MASINSFTRNYVGVNIFQITLFPLHSGTPFRYLNVAGNHLLIDTVWHSPDFCSVHRKMLTMWYCSLMASDSLTLYPLRVHLFPLFEDIKWPVAVFVAVTSQIDNEVNFTTYNLPVLTTLSFSFKCKTADNPKVSGYGNMQKLTGLYSVFCRKPGIEDMAGQGIMNSR